MDEAVAFLRRAPVMHLACCREGGVPMLKTVHGVVLDGAVYFHSSPVGEKTEGIGKPVVLSAEEIVAEVPSYFSDPERACPATTLYRSVQVHGLLEEVPDPAQKARALQALMERFQPEGGHVPITADHPFYRGPVSGLLVARVALKDVDGKAKLAQNKKPEERRLLVERLWQRGRRGDAEAIERVLRANPDTPCPDFLAAAGVERLSCALFPDEVADAVELIAPEFWNQAVPRERIARALLEADAWVGARDRSGRLVAHARATSDGSKYAWIYDVVVAKDWRGRGLSKALVRMLLDHPVMRDVRQVWLSTHDAQGLYAKFGFKQGAEIPPRVRPVVDMALTRKLW